MLHILALTETIFCQFHFANIFSILNDSRSDSAASKHFPNPQPKEARHEDFTVHHPFFQLPADERQKKIRCGIMSLS